MGIFELPEGYAEIRRINLQKDKKLAILVNVLALVIMVIMVWLGLAIKSLYSADTITEATTRQLSSFFTPAFVLLIAIIAYMVGHEIIHGVFIKKYSGKKAKYGFTGIYAYAGSDAFFNKEQYLVIALAPVVIFGGVFLALNIFLPQWFWPIYILQTVNLSGAAGDFYITYAMRKAPADVLTNDEGFEMILYSRSG